MAWRWALSASSAWARIRPTSSPSSLSCAAHLVGVAPGGVERTLEAQELLGVIAQRDRGLDLPAQLAHADLDLIELLAALTHALS